MRASRVPRAVSRHAVQVDVAEALEQPQGAVQPPRQGVVVATVEELGEGAVEDVMGLVGRVAAHQVDGQVVRGPERRRRSGAGEVASAASVRTCDTVGRPHGTTAWPRESRPRRPARPGESGRTPPTMRPAAAVFTHLGQPLDHHRASRHVDAQGQGLGGEDHPQQAGGEAVLDRLAEGGDQAGVVRRQAGLEAGHPRAVPEDAQLLVGQTFGVLLAASADLGPLLGGGQTHPVGQALRHGVVAGGPARR